MIKVNFKYCEYKKYYKQMICQLKPFPISLKERELYLFTILPQFRNDLIRSNYPEYLRILIGFLFNENRQLLFGDDEIFAKIEMYKHFQLFDVNRVYVQKTSYNFDVITIQLNSVDKNMNCLA